MNERVVNQFVRISAHRAFAGIEVAPGRDWSNYAVQRLNEMVETGQKYQDLIDHPIFKAVIQTPSTEPLHERLTAHLDHYYFNDDTVEKVDELRKALEEANALRMHNATAFKVAQSERDIALDVIADALEAANVANDAQDLAGVVQILRRGISLDPEPYYVSEIDRRYSKEAVKESMNSEDDIIYQLAVFRPRQGYAQGESWYA